MFVFWMALSLLVYVYVGYPIVAWTRARLWPRAHRPRGRGTDGHGDRRGSQRRTTGSARDSTTCWRSTTRRRSSRSCSRRTVRRTTRSSERASTRKPACTVRAFAKRRGKPAVLNDVVPSRAARSSCSPTRVSASSATPSVRSWRTLRIRMSAPSSGELMLTADRRHHDRKGRVLLLAVREVHPTKREPERARRSARPARSTRSGGRCSSRFPTTRFSTTC